MASVEERADFSASKLWSKIRHLWDGTPSGSWGLSGVPSNVLNLLLLPSKMLNLLFILIWFAAAILSACVYVLVNLISPSRKVFQHLRLMKCLLHHKLNLQHQRDRQLVKCSRGTSYAFGKSSSKHSTSIRVIFIQSKTCTSVPEYSESNGANKFVMLLSNWEDYRGLSPVFKAGCCHQIALAVPPVLLLQCCSQRLNASCVASVRCLTSSSCYLATYLAVPDEISEENIVYLSHRTVSLSVL